MTPKDDLFRLISALTPHERQAFTKASQGLQRTEPKYLRLFKCLCELPQYEEAAFLASRKGAAFRSNYSVQKKELFEKILLVLRGQRQHAGAEKPMRFQVRESVEDARILAEKLLFDLSRSRMRHALQEAQKYELHEVMLEILRQERKLVMDEQSPGYQVVIQQIHQQIHSITEIVQNKNRMLALRDQLFLPTRDHAQLAHQVSLSELESILKAPELQDLRTCLSFDARSNFHFCHAIYQHLSSNAVVAWHHFQAIYQLWQTNAALQRVRPLDYRNMLQNYLSFSNDAMRYEDFDAAATALMKGPFRSEVERTTAEVNLMKVSVQKHLNLCAWSEVGHLERAFGALEPHIDVVMRIGRLLPLYLSFSRLHFVQENWDQSRYWARKVIEVDENNLGRGVILQAYMQEMIALFELKETVLLDKLRHKVQRAIGRAAETSFERSLMKLLVDRAGMVVSADFRKALQKIWDRLEATDGRKSTADRVLRVWIQAKLELRSMVSILEAARDNA